MGKIGHAYDYIYRENFYFYFEWTPEEMRAKVWTHFHVSETCRGKCFEMKDGIHIWIKNRHEWGTMVHECIHAANYLLKEKGVKVSRTNDEPLTYYAQWLFEHCMEESYETIERKSKRKTLRTRSKKSNAKSHHHYRNRRR